MTIDPVRSAARHRRRTLSLAVVVVAVTVAVDLAAKSWAERVLSTKAIEAGPVDLQLGYNAGVAFGLGADAPTAAVIAVTALITAAVAVATWRTALTGTRAQTLSMAAICSGAVANVLDRAQDGVVTDYLHTGWWPTFNLADTAIVTGAALLLRASLRANAQDGASEPLEDEPMLDRPLLGTVSGDDTGLAARPSEADNRHDDRQAGTQ